MEEYFNKYFYSDLKRIDLQSAPDHIMVNPSIYKFDSSLRFFGGLNWENFSNDLSFVLVKNHQKFVLSLFYMVCNDMSFYTHFKNQYPDFRKITNFPKFGQWRFAPRFELPQVLLIVAKERGKLLFSDELLAEYANFWVNSIKKFLESNFESIHYKDFMLKLLDDEITQSAILQSDEIKVIFNNIRRQLD